MDKDFISIELQNVDVSSVQKPPDQTELLGAAVDTRGAKGGRMEVSAGSPQNWYYFSLETEVQESDNGTDGWETIPDTHKLVHISNSGDPPTPPFVDETEVIGIGGSDRKRYLRARIIAYIVNGYAGPTISAILGAEIELDIPDAGLLPYALTTLERVKTLLTITTNQFDALLKRTINQATDFIENKTNRRFLLGTYTNEMHSLYGEKQEYVLLKQSPVANLTKIEYRAGTPDHPNFTQFIPTQYYLLEDGKSGIVRIYGFVLRGTNVVRATYDAGYLIDFNHEGDTAKHNLPADLSALCDRLVVRWFKRRELGGKQSESLQGGSVNWKDALDSEDTETLKRYTRLPVFT